MMFGVKLGLEQVRELAASAGDPFSGLRFIHVAGTNGKGSVCAMLEACLRRAGFKTGLYSSPHLISVRERFLIDGVPVGEGVFEEAAGRLRLVAERMRSAGSCPTYFEFTTVLATMLFAETGVDFVLWETGMGGRLDATNAVDSICSVITGIGLDHQAYLGDSLAAIAGEKAGIIKAGRPVFAGDMPSEALAVVAGRARELDSRFQALNDSPELRDLGLLRREGRFYRSIEWRGGRFELSLAAAYQRGNARLALAVLDFLADKFGFDALAAAENLAEAEIAGRMQFMPDGSILDGAHNPPAMRALVESLREMFPGEKFNIIFAGFADKDVGSGLRTLAIVADELVFTDLSIDIGGRGFLSAGALADIAAEVAPGVPVRLASSVGEALAMTSSSRRLVTGSLYLVGEALKILYNDTSKRYCSEA